MVQGHVTTLMSNAANIEGAVSEADLVTCAVLIPGAKTAAAVFPANHPTHPAAVRPRLKVVAVALPRMMTCLFKF